MHQERSDLMKHLESEAEKNCCCICMSAQKNATLFPCMHVDFCIICINKHMALAGACPKGTNQRGAALALGSIAFLSFLFTAVPRLPVTLSLSPQTRPASIVQQYSLCQHRFRGTHSSRVAVSGFVHASRNCYRVMLIQVIGLVLLGTHQSSHAEYPSQ
ncbi:TPA: hypothetical protein ACH3X1_008777 [Trebouxia sp. C0004]